MEKLLEIMPILLLCMGQLMLSMICINQQKEIRRLKNKAIETLAMLLITRTELNLSIFPEIPEHEEGAEHGKEEQQSEHSNI